MPSVSTFWLSLIQEACLGPVRRKIGQHAQLPDLAELSEADLNPVLKDFLVLSIAKTLWTACCMH